MRSQSCGAATVNFCPKSPGQKMQLVSRGIGMTAQLIDVDTERAVRLFIERISLGDSLGQNERCGFVTRAKGGQTGGRNAIDNT